MPVQSCAQFLSGEKGLIKTAGYVVTDLETQQGDKTYRQSCFLFRISSIDFHHTLVP